MTAHIHCANVFNEAGHCKCFNCAKTARTFTVENRQDRGTPPMFDGEKIDASRMLRGRDPKHREDFDGDIQETLGIIAVRLVSGDKGFFLSSAQFDFDRIQLPWWTTLFEYIGAGKLTGSLSL